MNTQFPSVGAAVSVTCKTQNINYFTHKNQPFTFTTYRGKVVSNPKWLDAEYFCVETGNKNHPISMINIKNVSDIEVIDGVVSGMQTFPVAGSKGKMYNVKKSNDSYSCDCTGFTYRGKCKHVSLVRNDYYE